MPDAITRQRVELVRPANRPTRTAIDPGCVVMRFAARGLLLASFSLLALSTGHHGAVAAGFDCKRAKSLVEKQICGVPELSRLDGEVATLYTRTLAVLANDGATSLREEQRGWLREREECREMIHGDPVVMADVLACIRKLMNERKERLDAIGARKEFFK
jgi:uncharacterized protein YecT (DUF1311 family)